VKPLERRDGSCDRVLAAPTSTTAISLALQHGVLIDKFTGTRFEPSGFAGNQEIPIAASIMDYLFRWLAIRVPLEGTSPLVDSHLAAQRAQLDLPKIPLMSEDFVKNDMAPSIPVEVKDRAWVKRVLDRRHPLDVDAPTSPNGTSRRSLRSVEPRRARSCETTTSMSWSHRTRRRGTCIRSRE